MDIITLNDIKLSYMNKINPTASGIFKKLVGQIK